ASGETQASRLQLECIATKDSVNAAPTSAPPIKAATGKNHPELSGRDVTPPTMHKPASAACAAGLAPAATHESISHPSVASSGYLERPNRIPEWEQRLRRSRTAMRENHRGFPSYQWGRPSTGGQRTFRKEGGRVQTLNPMLPPSGKGRAPGFSALLHSCGGPVRHRSDRLLAAPAGGDADGGGRAVS